jgi:hypothetical protein
MAGAHEPDDTTARQAGATQTQDLIAKLRHIHKTSEEKANEEHKQEITSLRESLRFSLKREKAHLHMRSSAEQLSDEYKTKNYHLERESAAKTRQHTADNQERAIFEERIEVLTNTITYKNQTVSALKNALREEVRRNSLPAQQQANYILDKFDNIRREINHEEMARSFAETKWKKHTLQSTVEDLRNHNAQITLRLENKGRCVTCDTDLLQQPQRCEPCTVIDSTTSLTRQVTDLTSQLRDANETLRLQRIDENQRARHLHTIFDQFRDPSNPPPEIQDPLSFRALTTLAINHAQDAARDNQTKYDSLKQRLIDRYRRRAQAKHDEYTERLEALRHQIQTLQENAHDEAQDDAEQQEELKMDFSSETQSSSEDEHPDEEIVSHTTPPTTPIKEHADQA